jgi:hypothetical protein
MYITQEQEEYLKALIKEESVLNTTIGDFGFDTPIGDGKNNNEDFINSWENTSKIKSELKRIYKDIINISYDKDRLNEDGECCGATSSDSSGQYTTPLFGKPIKRKTMYITQEQEEYLKNIIKEESVMNTSIGDFGYDVPFNGNNKFFKDANDHNNIMKKSWPNEN